MTKNITEEKVSAILGLHESGTTSKEIAARLSCSYATVRRVLWAGGAVKRRSNGHECRQSTELTQQQRDIIIGLLLGDGSVIRHSRDKTAKLQVKTTEKELSSYLHESLPLQLKTYTEPPCVRIIKGKACSCKKAYRIESRVDLSLNRFRDEWYPSNIKLVPKSIELSPLSIKVWYYGDGTSSFVKKNGTPSGSVIVSFYTNSFTVPDCEFLVQQLQEKTGVSFRIVQNRGQPVLTIYNRELVHKFFNYIGESDLTCYKYKWKLPTKIEGEQ